MGVEHFGHFSLTSGFLCAVSLNKLMYYYSSLLPADEKIIALSDFGINFHAFTF